MIDMFTFLATNAMKRCSTVPRKKCAVVQCTITRLLKFTRVHDFSVKSHPGFSWYIFVEFMNSNSTYHNCRTYVILYDIPEEKREAKDPCNLDGSGRNDFGEILPSVHWAWK